MPPSADYRILHHGMENAPHVKEFVCKFSSAAYLPDEQKRTLYHLALMSSE